jgi:hypothetical protein
MLSGVRFVHVVADVAWTVRLMEAGTGGAAAVAAAGTKKFG